MLQQNNNNNHLCLDMGHRETLHGRRCNTAPFSSALGLGAIPLIKGLRAWAISGGYSRSRRKAVPNAPPDGRTGHRSRVSQVPSGHRKTEDCIASFHTPGVRQGGLGALVTVATLKGPEGSRQTQTRCLFLKAEGCSYLCTVSNRAAGTRGVGQRAYINLLDSNETTLGRRRNKEDVGAFEVKPQVIPKWRKSSKVTRPIERGLAAESKGTFDFSRLEQGWLDKRDSFPTQLVEKKEASHGTSAIAQCLKTKYRHVNRSIQPDLVNQNDLANGNESFNNDKAHLNSSELFPPPENSASAKVNASVGEQGLGHKSSNCEVHTCKERPSLCINGIDDAKHSSEHKSGLVADASLYHTAKCKGPNFVSSVPKFKEHSSGFPVLTQVTHKTYGDKELKEKLSMGYEESIVVPESRNPSDSTEAEQECNWKDRIDKVSLNSENEKPMLTIHTEFTVQDEALDRGSTIHQGMNARVRAGLGEEQWCSPACSSWHVEDVDTKCETPEKRFVKSQSRISSFLKAAATSLLNPVLNTTSNGTGALATNILAASEQEEVGAIVGNIGPQPGSELLAEQEMGLDGDMVTTNEKPVVMGQEEEDDFGVFMQAGEEQIWPEGFNELQQVPCRKQDCVEYTNPFDANEPMSWTSNWSGVQTSQQSVDSWSAFEQEMVPGVQWWSSKAKDSTYLTPTSLHNVHRVFLEAFSCAEPPCGDFDCILTLNELLWGPAEKIRDRKPGNLKLWDGLQNLEQMIDVKYKRAECMSHKFLLRSLHLGIPNSEHVHGRKQAAVRISPNLLISGQTLAAKAKRRLSYDINRNIVA
ncbi:uncharacterized protein si:ch211-14c7.2 isoform X2 [Electrophorus electricus]|uniref:uncharacterized protein si:ch211-14c7.2 isoform X2 n=1 Tax=Electrophorus electricus TaxID=8005 RepID=UPI0015D0CE1E|nr:uncharacterized protein si:ch211-14c7.2 isoform X2 [Electrophorus electricus]